MDFFVKDIMSSDVIAVKDNAKIKDVIKTMAQNEISGVPVVDEDDYVKGVVSHSDITKEESSYSFYRDTFSVTIPQEVYQTNDSFMYKPVSSIMSHDIFSIDEEETIAKMCCMMYEHKIHRLMVTQDEKIIGIVTTFDLLKLMASNCKL